MYLMFQKKQNNLDEVVIQLQLKSQVTHQQVQDIQTKNNNYVDLIGDLDRRIEK